MSRPRTSWYLQAALQPPMRQDEGHLGLSPAPHWWATISYLALSTSSSSGSRDQMKFIRFKNMYLTKIGLANQQYVTSRNVADVDQLAGPQTTTDHLSYLALQHRPEPVLVTRYRLFGIVMKLNQAAQSTSHVA